MGFLYSFVERITIVCEAALQAQLVSLVAKSDVTMQALHAARGLGLRSWCIGAGVIRNLVWDHLHGFKVATIPDDIDLVFYEAADLSRDLERFLEDKLAVAAPQFNWEVVNQAAVHTWLVAQGQPALEPFQSMVEGVASWPEFATCVGISLTSSDQIEVVAPHGLADLFAMVVRWNPARVTEEVYLARLAEKRFTEKWPLVRVLPSQRCAPAGSSCSLARL